MIIVELTNRFKGLDLIKCLKTMDGSSLLCTEGGDKNHLQEKEMQKDKMVVWGGLKNNWEKKRHERQKVKGKKKRYTHLNSEFQRIEGEIRKSF